MKRLIAIILCITLTLTLCSCGRGLKRFEKSFMDAFDTVSNIVAYDTDETAFEAHYKLLHDKTVYYSRLFDIYADDTEWVNLKYVNENAIKEPIKVDSAILDLLSYGKEVYQITDGAVNICMGSVLKIWHAYREEGTRVPDKKTLQRAAQHCNIEDLILDKENGTVFFADSKLSLDVGAIAKGYAAKLLCDYAKSELWGTALLNLGGNVATFGTKPDGGKWNVQIENPDPSANAALKTLAVTDTSVVTSGDYQRYYEVDGKRYCHIIDPKTLMPAAHFHAVSVVCSDAALADALSTALFILPLDEGKKLLQRYPDANPYWVDETYQVIE